MAQENFGYYCTLKDITFEAAKLKVAMALAEEGFGVLTEIDVQATLKKKLGADFREYIILGACNPQLAMKALGAEPHAGLMLPCNVVIQDRMGAEGIMVSLQNPTVLAGLVENRELQAIAHEADVGILKVLVALGGAVPKNKPARLEDVTPEHPDQYPAKAMKARLDARQDKLNEVKEHYSSQGLQDTE